MEHSGRGSVALGGPEADGRAGRGPGLGVGLKREAVAAALAGLIRES